MRSYYYSLGKVLFLFFCFSGLQAQNMYVRAASGSQTSHGLGDIQKLIFSSGNLVLNQAIGGTATYGLSALRYLNFKDLTLDIALPFQDTKKAMLYPNPVSDVLHILSPNQGEMVNRIEIISLEGRLVQQQNSNTQTGMTDMTIAWLPQGMYFCKIYAGNTMQTIKILKQ